MKIVLIVGTRPEIIKMSSLIRVCEKEGLDYVLIHTNQHFSYGLDKIFFDELKLPQPKYNLNINNCSPINMVGRICIELEKIFLLERPDIVLVQGDTNTVLAGALAANKLNIKLGHVEAGLRSYDKAMPEEHNRIITDHISDFLFLPHNKTILNLTKEGFDRQNLIVVGNTIVDAVFQNLEIAEKESKILETHNLKSKNYFLITLHRPGNVDSSENLKEFIDSMEKLYQNFGIPLIFPIHPRTENNLNFFGLNLPSCITTIPPIGFLDFLKLEKNAKLILTDSGGIQEEACILNVPCITLRKNTERPETIEVGANILTGLNSQKIIDATNKWNEQLIRWDNPFGDGTAGKKIIDFVLSKDKSNEN